MGATLRAFVAFELAADIIRHAEKLQGDLTTRGLRLRWVRAQNIHLTMKFLGDIRETDIPDVTAAMQTAVQGFGPLDLAVQGMGAFPGVKRPRVLWIGLGGQVELLKRLHAGLEEALEGVGFPKEKRPFKAHLTLGRTKGAIKPQRLIDAIQELGHYSPRLFQVRQLVLFQSDLHPQGAVYTPKATALLG